VRPAATAAHVLLVVSFVLAFSWSAHGEGDTEAQAEGSVFQVGATEQMEANSSPLPSSGADAIVAPASEGQQVDGTWSVAPTGCASMGGALCHEYFACADGSVATDWIFTPASGSGGPQTYNQCPDDPAPTETTAPATVLPALTPGRILQAFREVPLPESDIVVQPPDGETLVNFETVFSTDAESFTETVRLLGRSVTLEITPAEFTWHHGDGTSHTTDWAGRPWTSGMTTQDVADELVHHVYTRRATGLAVSVDTIWSARYRVNDGPWADVGGTVTMTGAPQPLDVLEARPVLTAG
jgi:hypothetical protein